MQHVEEAQPLPCCVLILSAAVEQGAGREDCERTDRGRQCADGPAGLPAGQVGAACVCLRPATCQISRTLAGENALLRKASLHRAAW